MVATCVFIFDVGFANPYVIYVRCYLLRSTFVVAATMSHGLLVSILPKTHKYISNANGKHVTFVKILRCNASQQSTQLWNSQISETCATSSSNREVSAAMVRTRVTNVPRKNLEIRLAGNTHRKRPTGQRQTR